MCVHHAFARASTGGSTTLEAADAGQQLQPRGLRRLDKTSVSFSSVKEVQSS